VLCRILCSEFLLLTAVGLSQGQLTVSPAAITFLTNSEGAAPGSPTPCAGGGSCVLSILSNGSIPYTLTAPSVADPCPVIGPCTWLELDRISGTTPDTIHVSVHPETFLNVGTYSATITVTAPLATNSPLKIPVTLTVATNKLVISPNSLTFNATVGETSIAPRTSL
jgi:hypothetical protein